MLCRKLFRWWLACQNVFKIFRKMAHLISFKFASSVPSPICAHSKELDFSLNFCKGSKMFYQKRVSLYISRVKMYLCTWNLLIMASHLNLSITVLNVVLKITQGKISNLKMPPNEILRRVFIKVFHYESLNHNCENWLLPQINNLSCLAPLPSFKRKIQAGTVANAFSN